MHWKLKSLLQNLASFVPSSVSNFLYYRIQRHFGRLRRIDPAPGFKAGIDVWRLLVKQGVDPSGKTFFEVGTGRIPLVPLAFWLMGADKTITMDVDCLLRGDLIRESLDRVSAEPERMRSLFGSFLRQDRLDDLIAFRRKAGFRTRAFLDSCSIEYVAPRTAARTGVTSESVDFHTSYCVFEHIPYDDLMEVVREGNRITRPAGLFIHRIDYSDHFSHFDKGIPGINFLRYSDAEWNRYVRHRYMYQNRLRHDDFLLLFRRMGHEILADLPDTDIRYQQVLRNGTLKLDERFRAKPTEILQLSGAWILSGKQGAWNHGRPDPDILPLPGSVVSLRGGADSREGLAADGPRGNMAFSPEKPRVSREVAEP